MRLDRTRGLVRAKPKNFPYLSYFPRRGVWGEPTKNGKEIFGFASPLPYWIILQYCYQVQGWLCCGYVSSLESGKRNPTLAMIEKIAGALGVKSDELLK